MQASVAHLSVSQRNTFASVVSSSHTCSDTALVERETSYSGILYLWEQFERAQLQQDACVPVALVQHSKLQALFESFHRGDIAIIFLLSHADTVLCMFQHAGTACHVEFEAPCLSSRIKDAMWDNQIFSSLCFSWVYPGVMTTAAQ